MKLIVAPAVLNEGIAPPDTLTLMVPVVAVNSTAESAWLLEALYPENEQLTKEYVPAGTEVVMAGNPALLLVNEQS